MAVNSSVSTIENYPVFTTVEEVYAVNGNQVYLYVKLYESKEFNNHYSCYFVTPTTTYKLLTLESFLSYLPLHMYKLNMSPIMFCIVPKFYLCV